jgi:CBS domain containing-hemolysin-like protein
VKAGNSTAQLLLKQIDNPPRSLAPIHFINSLALLLIAAAGTWHALERSTDPYAILTELGSVIAVLVIGKALADVLGTSRALAIALLAARPLNLLLQVSSPLWEFNVWLTRLAKGPRARPHNPDKVTTDDIQIIVADGEEQRKIDLIDPEEREMIAGIIEMGERAVSEIMIPRIDVIALEVNSLLADALEVVTQYGHSRLPVYKEDIDHIVGILHVKDLIQVLRQTDQNVPLHELCRPVHYVPETAKTDDLLRELLRNRVHMAIVVDEYGGTAGIITIEDLIEEIVGEIRDEYDTAEEPPFVRISEDEAVFNARESISEVNEVMGTELPTEESDSIGGLVYTRLGKMPRVGDSVRVGEVELTVAAVVGRRMKQVRVVKLHPIVEANESAELSAKTNEPR